MELSAQLPEPRLSMVYRLESALGEPLEIGDVSTGHRRIIRLDGGTVTGPEINGKLLTGVSADWQIVLPDGTALIDIRLHASNRRRRPPLRALDTISDRWTHSG